MLRKVIVLLMVLMLALSFACKPRAEEAVAA